MQVSRLLQYSPVRRYSALQALTHPFFDELRDQSVTLPNGMAPSLYLETACKRLTVRVTAYFTWAPPHANTFSTWPERKVPPFIQARQKGLMRHAGRDLPPLFNWQKGELDHADPALAAALQPGAAASSSQAAARPGGSS